MNIEDTKCKYNQNVGFLPSGLMFGPRINTYLVVWDLKESVSHSAKIQVPTKWHISEAIASRADLIIMILEQPPAKDRHGFFDGELTTQVELEQRMGLG
jgi:hypothetical protein